jgi:HK97 family phage prohead protease
MSRIYQYKDLGIEMAFKDVNTATREVVFQFAAYGNVDSYGDISTKGMFNRSINNNFKRIKHFLDHDPTKVPGVPMQIWEDEQGAYVKSKIGDHWEGEDFMKKVDSGIITEASYGYATVKEEKSAEGNVLREVKLWETSSLQAWGANEHTRLVSYVKAGGNPIDYAIKAAERVEKLEKFCKNSNATDETIELLLIEIKQLQSLIADIMTTDAAEEATPPVDEAKVKAEQDEALARIKLMELKLN